MDSLQPKKTFEFDRSHTAAVGVQGHEYSRKNTVLSGSLTDCGYHHAFTVSRGVKQEVSHPPAISFIQQNWNDVTEGRAKTNKQVCVPRESRCCGSPHLWMMALQAKCEGSESHSVVLNVSFIIIAHYNVCIIGVSQSGRSDKLKSISTGQCRSRSLFTIPTVSRGLSQEEEARGFGVMRCVSVSANHSAVTSVGFFLSGDNFKSHWNTESRVLREKK